MNKFLNKKKAPEAVSSNSDAFSSVSSLPLISPGLKKSATSRWKKQKKQPEPQPEINLAELLPASDDFRTSLLMPNLSARFSMLREQDDPNSLLGKASDDSVLQPRRRSRLTDFGFAANGLNDIAEVQSISSSIRPPPFAGYRQESYNSEEGYGSDNESTRNAGMLGRARPGEGNNLFGGRQKVYKIAGTGATSKAVYEDDIGMSAFQRYRKEREAAENWHAEEDPSFDFGLDQTDTSHQERPQHAPAPNDSAKDLSESAKDLSHSPSLSSYDRKRSTTSSMARSEARSSTAATSIASQPAVTTPSPFGAASQTPAPVTSAPSLKRSDTKTRRLYEQGLDQHIQEQQTSAMTRLNSIQRQRTLNHGMQSPPFLYSAKSATNLSEMKPHQPVYALRTQSPPPMAPLTTFGPVRMPSSNNDSPLGSGPQSPVSPQVIEFPEFNQALEPGDRGKATAMGAFTKPQQQFDEQQYLERQQQLQRSQSKSGPRKDAAAQSAFHQRFGRLEQADRERSGSNSSRQRRISKHEQADRSRSGSNTSTRSRSRSASKQHEPSKAYNVFQNAANQIASTPGAQQYDTHRTFFGNISASDSEEEDDDMSSEHTYGHTGFSYGAHGGQSSHGGRWQPAALPPVSEHPALRGQASKASLAEEDEFEEEDLEPKPLRPTPSSRSPRTDALYTQAGATVEIDSPTLGPSGSEPLNGMVHHLRQQSNQSSIYPNDEDLPMDEVPEIPELPGHAKDSARRAVRSTLDSESRIESTYTNSNPWDLDDIENPYTVDDGYERASISPIESMQTTSRFGSRAPSRATLLADRQSEVSQGSEGVDNGQWQHELRKQHTRDASTATQAERDAFANELAARRNAIQENMKSIVERETQSRGGSPAPSANGAFKAFNMLRSKSSRESVDISRGPSAPTKAMKMLGIGNNASSNTLSSQYDRSGFSFEVARPRKDSAPKAPPMPTVQAPRGPLNDYEQTRARGESDSSRSNGTSSKIGKDPASAARSRSNSEVTTGRSRSRTGPYRDDLEKAMIEGTGSSAAGLPDLSPLIPRELTPRPSPEVAQSQFEGDKRARSNSRPAPPMNSYFEPKNLLSIHTAALPNGRLAPTAGTPATLSPNVYSPAASSIRASPSVSPIAQNPTPPLSGANTPSTPNFNMPPMPTIQPRQGVLRKKTISKSNISEPTLISSTSNIDTVDLPEGASLQNGMEQAPPLPPINPKRRGTRKIFGLGRSEMSDNAINYGNYGRSKTPDPWMNGKSPEPDFEAMRSPLKRPGLQPQGFENHSSPAIQQYSYVPPGTTSPERVERSPVPQYHGRVEGGMF